MTTDDLRKRAREAADAAEPVNLDARHGYVRGYLAHAAQQPTRGQIARTLHDHDLDGTACMSDEQECMEHYRRAADAVLRLLNGEGE